MTKIELLKINSAIIDQLVKAGFIDFRIQRNINLFYKMQSLMIAGMSKHRAACECEHIYREKDIKVTQIKAIFDDYQKEI